MLWRWAVLGSKWASTLTTCPSLTCLPRACLRSRSLALGGGGFYCAPLTTWTCSPPTRKKSPGHCSPHPLLLRLGEAVLPDCTQHAPPQMQLGRADWKGSGLSGV